MPPFRRLHTRSSSSASAAIPTLLSITKLLRLIPSALFSVFSSSSSSSTHPLSKRAYGQWGLSELSEIALEAASKTPIEPEDPPGSPQFVWKLVLSVGLVLLGGVFAGLTLALMGSDDLNLRVLSQSSDDPKERKSAAKVLKLLERGRHWVLVVLLLSNVIVNESLPIFLDDVLGGGLAAVIVSTTMIVIFGEIIPQAVCVRYGLAIGGVCAPFVLGMMYLFYPIAYPIAKLLDRILGVDAGHTYKKAELKSFLQFHREGEEPLRDDEIVILNGVLSLNERHVQEIMTPIADCLTLPADKVLDHEAIDHILLSGFSRIPIHEPGQKDNFTGMLLVKRLITYNPEDEWPVSKFPLLPLPEAKPSINCFQALDYFQTGRAHLLLISETPGHRGGAMGIVSLEDLIEEIIGEEIIDETDRFQDNHSKKQAVRKGTATIMKGIIERNRVINAFSRRPSRSDSLPVHTVNTVNGVPADALLIQVDNGAMTAEAITTAPPTTDSDTAGNSGESRKLAIPTGGAGGGAGNKKGMSPIAEAAREGGGSVISERTDLGLKGDEGDAASAVGSGPELEAVKTGENGTDVRETGGGAKEEEKDKKKNGKKVKKSKKGKKGEEGANYAETVKKNAGTSRENLLDDRED